MLFLPFLAAILLSMHDVTQAKDVRAALIIIDVQDCFLAGGSLAVSQGNDVIPVINKIRRHYGSKFSMIALSKDWHCPDHVSFASSHPGKNVGDNVELKYEQNGTLCLGDSVTAAKFPMAESCPANVTTRNLTQHMWPVHCVQNVTSGPTSAELADSLLVEVDDNIILKGTRCELDSYSAFFDNGKFGQTNLDAILKSKGINTVFVTGLALDFCVFFTSMDAHDLGYDTYTVVDATRGVAKDSVDKAVQDLTRKGVHLIKSDQIGDVFNGTPALGQPLTVVIFAFTISWIMAL